MDARDVITRGTSAWNQWREDHPSYAWGEYDLTHISSPEAYRLPIFRPDLSGVELDDKDLTGINLEGCLLKGANLRGTLLDRANLDNADLTEADLYRASLVGSHGLNTTFCYANMRAADCRDSSFCYSDFEHACLNEIDLRGARISDSLVYGIAAWAIRSDNSIQANLHITKHNWGDARLINSSIYHLRENTATVDNIDIAVLLHLLAHYNNPGEILNLVSTRITLILGRFTLERKNILYNIRVYLKGTKYCPVIFDFVKPANRTFTETISTKPYAVASGLINML